MTIFAKIQIADVASVTSSLVEGLSKVMRWMSSEHSRELQSAVNEVIKSAGDHKTLAQSQYQHQAPQDLIFYGL